MILNDEIVIEPVAMSALIPQELPRSSSRAIPVLARFVRQRNANHSLLSGLDQASLEHPDLLLPVTILNQLWHAAREFDPGIGLKLIDQYLQSDMHLVGHVVSRCDTLGEALGLWCRLSNLVSESDRLSSAIDGREAKLEHKCSYPQLACHSMVEHNFVMAYRYSSAFVGQAVRPQRVRLTHARPDYASDYVAAFGIEPEFDQSINEMCFDAHWLSTPLQTSDPYLSKLLLETATRRLASMNKTQSFEARQIDLLFQRLDRFMPISLEHLAKDQQLSEIKLQKLMRTHSVSYRSVLDASRKRALTSLLAQRLSIQVIAEALGFSEPAALQHACKRWYACSVGDLRKQMTEAERAA
jgi:AraC-like DNA-binding protein